MEFIFEERFNLLELVIVAVVSLFLAIGFMEKIWKDRIRQEVTGNRGDKKGRSDKHCDHTYEFIGTLPGFNEHEHGGSIFRHRCNKCGSETLLDEKLGAG